MTGSVHQFPVPPLYPFPDIKPFSDIHRQQNDNSSESGSDTDPELFDTTDFFTIEQDLFLVRWSCFQPELTHEEVTSKCQRMFGDDKDKDDLATRLKTLQAPAFQGLLALYVKAISLNRDASTTSSGVTSSSSATPIRPQYQALLQSTKTSCESKLLQLIYDDEKMRSEPSEMISVEVTSRNFPKYTRLVHKRHLQRCSRAIQSLYSNMEAEISLSPHGAFTLQSANKTNEQLHLTDSVPFYDNCMVFNHLEQPIFDRLMQFAKDPNLMERLVLMKQQHEESHHIKQALSHQLHAIYDAQRQLQITKLEQLRQREQTHIQQQLEKTLEADIAHLRKMHTSLLRHERAKIDAKFDQQFARLNDQIDDMKEEIVALQRNCESLGWNSLEREIMQSSLQVERIFGTSDFLLRLLILAEDLDAESLRRAIVRYLSLENHFPQFALRRELASKMISESTILSILKNTPTNDLRQVEEHGKAFIHHDLLAREFHTRRITFARFLAGLTNDQLRIVQRLRAHEIHPRTAAVATADGQLVSKDMLQQMATVLDFPVILEQEYTRRREFSCVKMQWNPLDRDVSMTEDDCVVQLEASNRYCTIAATKERKQGDSGKWMFEVTIETFGGEGESLLIGWEVPRIPATNDTNTSTQPPALSNMLASTSGSSCVPGLTVGTDGKSYGITWQSDGGLDMGMLHANGQSKSGVACFRAGDVIACTLNQDELIPYLRFYLNGVHVLPLPTSNASIQNTNTGISCHNPVYCLFPVISMYSSRKKPQMRVRFNFRGNFRFPIPDFEPYGAPLYQGFNQ